MGQLAIHIGFHTNEKPYFCVTCPASYSCGAGLTQNLVKKHNEMKIGKKCNVCQKLFYSISKLQVHLRRHNGEKPFSCLICSKIFVSKSNLNKQSLIYTGSKPWKCPKCPSKFRGKQGLNKHITAMQSVKAGSTF